MFMMLASSIMFTIYESQREPFLLFICRWLWKIRWYEKNWRQHCTPSSGRWRQRGHFADTSCGGASSERSEQPRRNSAVQCRSKRLPGVCQAFDEQVWRSSSAQHARNLREIYHDVPQWRPQTTTASHWFVPLSIFLQNIKCSSRFSNASCSWKSCLTCPRDVCEENIVQSNFLSQAHFLCQIGFSPECTKCQAVLTFFGLLVWVA